MSYLSKPFLIFLPLLSYLGVVLLLSPHITQAAGNTYYVRTGGQGSCGSAQTDNDASAVSSIQAGVNCIQGPGDTVIVHGGTYGSYGQNMNIPDISGNSSNRITLRAAGDGTVWMRGQLQFPFQTAQFWTVDGINIDGGYWPNNCANITESSSQSIPCRNVVMTSGSNNRFANMEVMHASYYGIEAGDNNTFIKVRSHDHGNDPQTLCRGNPATAGGQCHGFYTHDLNNVFDGVESYNNNGQGIALTLGSASVTVKNSKLHDNTGMAIQFAYAGTNHLIFNNLIYNNGSGFAVFASDSSQFYNNTIVGNGSCIDLVTDENGNGSDNNTLRNNICYQNGSTIFDQGSGNVQSNNLTTNPNFVNASNGDFHITSNSPARDAGTALSQVPCDHDGNARPAGSAYDIGAYEYGSSPGGGCSGSTSSPTPTPAPSGATCTQYTSSSQIPQGFGVPWDVTNPSVMLVSANCTPPTLLLKAEDPSTTKTVYVYKTGYVAPSGASSWSPVDLFGSQLLSGAWYPSSAQGVTNIPDQTKATFYLTVRSFFEGFQKLC